MLREQILPLFGAKIRTVIENETLDFEKLQEIRVRAGRPLILKETQGERLLNVSVNMKDIKEIVEMACGHSGYAFEEEIKRGYITIPGGHRIGLSGKAVLNGGDIQILKHISSVNIRIAHPVRGCAKLWESYVYQGGRGCHVLILSPPGCGKTTLLRDLIRMYSCGSEKYSGVNVGVVDERSEIAGTYRGIQNFDLGIRTDVLDGCPKSLGMEMLLRSMSPRVIAVDEIGAADVKAIENALRCGCKVLATMHGENMDEFRNKPGFESMVKERVFERYILLKQGGQPGKVEKILGKNFEILWEA